MIKNIVKIFGNVFVFLWDTVATTRLYKGMVN